MQWKHMQNATKEVWKNRNNKNGQQDGESLSNFLFLPYSDCGGGEFLFFYGQRLGGEGQKTLKIHEKRSSLNELTERRHRIMKGTLSSRTRTTVVLLSSKPFVTVGMSVSSHATVLT